MMAPARRSFVALTLVSAAFAIKPWFEDTILGRDLTVRQTDTTKCDPFGYRSRNGLNFTTYCGQNNPFNDAQPPFTASSMVDCMEHCSRYWGNREGCYGIVWVEKDGACWIRNSSTSTASLKIREGHYSALVENGQMSGYDTKCPFPDASVQTLSGVDGLGYTVNCNKVISGSDECFSGVPKPCTQPYFGFHHAETLEQCLRICVDSHPLCKAVSWSPDLKIGFANCWLKTGFPESGLPSPPSNAGILHSATITRIDPVDRNCPSSSLYVSGAGGNSRFDIHCGQLNTGTNITSIHTQNITSCMDACARSDQKCIGVVFDSGLQGGFENCYLQNTTSTVSNQASATYAVLNGSGTPAASSTPTSHTSSSSSSPSKAWIAGPVLGGIAALGLITFAAFWWRRRRNRRMDGGPHEKDVQHTPAPAYSSGVGAGGYYNGSEGVHAGPPGELVGSDDMARELPATTKYAHRAGAQELPS